MSQFNTLQNNHHMLKYDQQPCTSLIWQGSRSIAHNTLHCVRLLANMQPVVRIQA